MDQILQTLLSWQFLIFGVAIASIMSVLRRIVEFCMAGWAPLSKESKLWSDLLLPILPVILGVLVALLFKSYPYPDGLTTSGGRFIFGLVAGLLSTLFYRIVKALINQKFPGLISTTTSINTDTNNPIDVIGDAKGVVQQVTKTINKE